VVKSFLVVLAASALLLFAVLAPASSGAGCAPLDCSTSQFAFAHGSLLGVRGNSRMPLRVIDLATGATRWRLPAGMVGGHTLVHQDGRLLTWLDAASGARVGDAVLQAHGTFVLAGVSQEGRQAVLARTQHRSTTFAIVSRRVERVVRLGGNRWSFDALNGDNLFLVRTVRAGYQVRLLHLRSGVLERAPLKDANEPATISGVPWSRVPSADGRYLFTLYVGPNGDSMVHVLDTRSGTARCVDLPGTGDFNAATSYALVVDPDPRQLWAVSPGYGRVARIDLPEHRVGDTYRFDASSAWNTNVGIATMSPDGERIAVTDAFHIWIVELAQRKVIRAPSHVAIALAYSPDQKHLWVLGERSRVTALPVR
jgi:hypothetical protein